MKNKILKNLKLGLAGIVLAGSFGIFEKGYGQDTIKDYSLDNILIGFKVYNKDDQLIGRMTKKGNGNVTHMHLYEYNNKGQIIKMKWLMAYKNENLELQRTELYEYDSKGQLIKETNFNKNGKIEYVKEYTK